jgi:hypothetical protein
MTETPPLSSEQIEQLCKTLGQAEGRLIAAAANSTPREPAEAVDDLAPIALRVSATMLLDPKTPQTYRRKARALLTKWVHRQSAARS